MTAEIAVMNRQGVALAADSAVTVTGNSGPKVFASANKIFSLSKHHPIGIMVFGNADFLSVPWETIVKEYRREAGHISRPTVQAWADDFIGYVRRNRRMFPVDQQKRFAEDRITRCFFRVHKDFLNDVKEAVRKSGELTDDDARDMLDSAIARAGERSATGQAFEGLGKDHRSRLGKQFGPIIKRAKAVVFDQAPLSAASSRRLTSIALDLFSRESGQGHSGLVFAGFGADEVFPSLVSFGVEGMALSRPLYTLQNSQSLSFQDDAYVAPFAQGEMVVTFMEGIDPDLNKLVWTAVRRIATEYPAMLLSEIAEKARTPALEKKLGEASTTLVEQLLNEIRDRQYQAYVQPILSVVASLPKDELAAMAEALINLTSFKRRVTMEQETVGGPIDVAVISKGDGFVWVKRKHYFDPRLNVQFFANYYREEDDG